MFVILIIYLILLTMAMINILHRHKPAEDHEQFHPANKPFHRNCTRINSTIHRIKRLRRAFQRQTYLPNVHRWNHHWIHLSSHRTIDTKHWPSFLHYAVSYPGAAF